MQITEAERVVMEALWSRHPRTAAEVVDALASTGWQDATIKTLLNRLLKKRAIRATKDGRRFLYSPAIDRDAWLLDESTGVLARLFGGRIAPLVAHFSAHRRLSGDDVAELRRLLDRIDADDR